jgi:hypothetical protein
MKKILGISGLLLLLTGCGGGGSEPIVVDSSQSQTYQTPSDGAQTDDSIGYLASTNPISDITLN